MTEAIISGTAGLNAPPRSLCNILTGNSEAQPQSRAAHCRPDAKSLQGGLIILATAICLLLGIVSAAHANLTNSKSKPKGGSNAQARQRYV